jgi:acyl-CoA thioesterase
MASATEDAKRAMTELDVAASTSFSDMLAALERQSDHFTIALPSDWLQGRTAYGGLSAALCLQATLQTFPDLPPLRSAQFSFVGPATGDLHVRAGMLRQGKSTAFANADLEGESGLAARATFCFGAERGLSFAYAGVPMPDAPSLDACPSFYTWPQRPNFMNHFDGRLAGGARPRTRDARPEMLVWLRHRDEQVEGGLVSLLALADALPPAATVLFREYAPISTMTWSIDIFDENPASATGWWLVQCAAETARLGYSAQNTLIWNSDGRPILAARQTIAIFEKG